MKVNRQFIIKTSDEIFATKGVSLPLRAIFYW